MASALVCAAFCSFMALFASFCSPASCAVQVGAAGPGLLHGGLHHLPHLRRHVREGGPGLCHGLLHLLGLLVDVDPGARRVGQSGWTVGLAPGGVAGRGTCRFRRRHGRTPPRRSPRPRAPAAPAPERSRCRPATARRSTPKRVENASMRFLLGQAKLREDIGGVGNGANRHGDGGQTGHQETCGNDETWRTPFWLLRTTQGGGKKLTVAGWRLRATPLVSSIARAVTISHGPGARG